ncbi:MAG: HNH endonuclease [Actinomycetota bacterium]|nr:HNH endonuclease [Actinomycetota bacterium]
MTCTISPPDAESATALSAATVEFGSVAAEARRVLAGQASPVWSRSDPALVREVADLFALRAQVDGLLLDAVGEVDSRGLAGSRGCSSTRAWLRWAHRIAPVEAGRLVRTATVLRRDLPAVAAAMSAGEVSLAQAEVIVHAIGDLPAETPVACRPQAEATMIDQAQIFDPVILARIGRRLAEIIDPDGVQARDEKPILDKEQDAHRDRTLTLNPDTNGAGGTLRARLDAQGYATLAAYLQADTAPGLTPDGQPESRADADSRHLGQRRHDALIEAARQMLTAGRLPTSGGVKPRIVVILPAASLANRTGAARLPDGTLISPSLARLISCDAEIIPVTVDPAGNPLDVGRSRRLFTGTLRTALEVRDRGCAWPGCDRPISWTQAHHILSWLDGGTTSLDNGVLLCLFHHHEIEKGDWTVTIRGGRAWFTPPAWIDPHRTPRINPMHHPPPT